MVVKPTLPDGYSLPERVGEWTHDPDSKKNGHVWYGPARECSVGVFNTAGNVYAHVCDERVDGFARTDEFCRQDVDDKPRAEQAAAVADAIERAVAWMQQHAPPWRHPDVNSAALAAPKGYVLDRYYLEERDTTIYYRREGAESVVRMAGTNEPEEWAYLRLHVWHGSGNAEVATAPWLRAHDDEVEPVVECPEECGLDVALMLAREWVREAFGSEDAVESPGQQSLARWSA